MFSKSDREILKRINKLLSSLKHTCDEGYARDRLLTAKMSYIEELRAGEYHTVSKLHEATLSVCGLSEIILDLRSKDEQRTD